MTDLQQIWEDQKAFNAQLRPMPSSPEEMVRLTKDFVLYLESELHELLRLTNWKAHRRGDTFDNPAHRFEEIADAFKCLISLAQYCGMSADDLVSNYWRKTAVVKQRYQEEWLGSLKRPCAIIDIDHVLCDYVTGFCKWLYVNSTISHDQILQVETATRWIDHNTMGVPREEWEKLKHAFRVSGAKSRLPVFPDAIPFLKALRTRNLQIILLTSRPIDRYPNMFTDTLDWLKHNEMEYDYIWWAVDKAEKVMETEIRHLARMVVDDDRKYIDQYAKAGMASYWLRRSGHPEAASDSTLIHPVSNLREVVEHYDESIRQQEAASW